MAIGLCRRAPELPTQKWGIRGETVLGKVLHDPELHLERRVRGQAGHICRMAEPWEEGHSNRRWQ